MNSLHSKEILEDGFSHGENLTLLIQQALDEEGISMKDLSAVSVASGPGSYTGLRIGVSTAKGICYALDLPLLAIDALTSTHRASQRKAYRKESVRVVGCSPNGSLQSDYGC